MMVRGTAPRGHEGGKRLAGDVRRLTLLAGALAIATVASGHVGSPDVFFRGKAGPYDIRVVVRPPEVVPGIARVTVRAPADVERVSIRPVYWRAGSKGAPSPDEATRVEGNDGGGTFAGSLWLMARGAYGVDVIVTGARGDASVLVPVASVATGRLEMGAGLGAILAALGFVLIAGLVTLVYKAAGESVVPPSQVLDRERRRRARRVAALSVPIIGLGLLGGARWWNAVDRGYERTLYRPAPLAVAVDDGVLRLQATDTLWRPPGRPDPIVRDHGKLMHLFMVRAGDGGAFAHLHPIAADTGASPAFLARVPPLPPARYSLYADVVHETGFERTLVGTVQLPQDSRDRGGPADADPDDAWFVGDASTAGSMTLADGSTMSLRVGPPGTVVAGRELTLGISVLDAQGERAVLQPYLGMPAHAVVARLDGEVYVHLHPMGTITVAAQQAFAARDRGDTTAGGGLMPGGHDMHSRNGAAPGDTVTTVEFPYAFPRAGEYRLFVQVRRDGRILTGAFAIPVADPPEPSR